MKDGEPVVGAKIERSTFWNMEKYPRLDYTYTNERGEFEFPEVRGSADFGWLARLLHQPSISQWIFLKGDTAQDILLFSNGRGSYEKAAETGLEVISFKCDIGKLSEFMPGEMKASCKVEVK